MVLEFTANRGSTVKYLGMDTEAKEFHVRTVRYPVEGVPILALRDWRNIVRGIKESGEFAEVAEINNRFS